jgi:putative endonuclease
MKTYYIYILFNKHNTVNYTGITGDLKSRVFEHKNKLINGFTKQYNVNKLVYYEDFDNPREAIEREKQIKSWNREKN